MTGHFDAELSAGDRPTHLAENELLQVEALASVRPPGWRVIVRRLLRNRLSRFGIGVLVILFLLIVFGPFVWRTDPNAQDLAVRLTSPSLDHPFGTDTNGRDLLSRVLHGGRISLSLSILTVLLSFTVGGAMGLVAGYTRGFADGVLMRLMDILLAFPALLLALAIAAALGTGMVNTVIAVFIPTVPRFARLMRSAVLSVRETDYVLAAKAVGVRPLRILTRHVLRNSITPVVVQASIFVGVVMLEIAALSYLGLGVQPPTAEWGAILTDSQAYLLQQPWAIVAPGLAISLAVLSFNLLGDALRDVLDPGR